MSISAQALQPRLANSQDDAALIALFERAFGAAISPALWQWKTQHLQGLGSLIYHDEQAIAYYGGIPRVLTFGQGALNAIQIRDVMVDPSWRGLLTRKGPFWSSASHFLSTMTGDNQPYTLAFGFPNGRHAQLGRKLKLYAAVDKIHALSWQSRRLPWLQRWRYTWHPLASHELDGVDAIARDMQAACTDYVMPLRNAQFLQQRYYQHPDHDYQVLLIKQRFSPHPLGVVVLHPMPEQQQIELVDMIALPQHLTLLLQVTLDATYSLFGPVLLSAWLTPAVQAYLPASDRIPEKVADVHIATPELDFWQAETQHRWWLMSGDTDFR